MVQSGFPSNKFNGMTYIPGSTWFLYWMKEYWKCLLHPLGQFLFTKILKVQLGDFMSKVREKRSTSKSGFFFYEMWKIIGQIDDFDRFLNNSCNLGVFLAKNQKYPKMTVLKKWKSEKKKIEKKLWLKTYVKYHI